jgi:multidrug efflux pump subunit AcrA (membrane-fusion protein)
VKPRPRPSAWAAAAWGAWTLALATAATQAAPPDTGTATYIDIHRTARAEAVVEAVRQSTLAAQVSGRVVAVAVRAGAAV